MNFAREVALLRQRFAASGTPERALAAKKYLKSELAFLGADNKAIRAAAKDLAEAHPEVSRAQLTAFVRTLWKTNVHELRSAGIALLELRRELVEPADLPFLEDLLRDAKTWAYVDWLAIHVAGDLAARSARVKKELRRWAKDPDFWVRRAALLALLTPLRKGGGDFALFTELAVPMLGDEEIFIRKAIGWVLRETAKKQPDLVRAFLAAHNDAISPLTQREASKHLAAK